MRRLSSNIAIGLAGASMPKEGKMVGDYAGSYAYVNNGTFRSYTVHNDQIFSNKKPKFEIDDIVGVGVNLTTRQIFYTNNGQRFDILDLQLDIAAGLYPAVSMNGPFDTIETNFGPNFEYKLSQEDGADVK
uniref:B30.2/SPRY domain-containing protein n=1 Tax=Globodera pallida TaxID=36090 RepID=A0A183C311_GLOPA